ncbi:hypothetical protein Tco_1556406 [Tanacetum coccineum]
MIAIQAEEGEGSGHPSEPQPPPSTAQPTNEEPILNVVSSSHQKTQSPRQALNQVTELPRTNQASCNINRTQSTTMPNVPLPRGIGAGGSPRCQEAMGGSMHRLGVHKMGRMIEEIDQDAGVTLVTPTHSQEDQPEDQLRVFSATKILVDAAKDNVYTYTRRRRAVSTSRGRISTYKVQEVNISISSPIAIKDKGKGKMEESKDEHIKRTKLLQEQDRLWTLTVRDCKRNWMKKKDKGWLEFMKQLNLLLRKNEKTLKQELKLMRIYLGDYKYSFDELKELFETTMKNVNTFVPMETKDRGRASELAAGSSQATIIDSAKVGSSKRAAEAELDHEGSKRKKTNETLGSVQEQPEEEEK